MTKRVTITAVFDADEEDIPSTRDVTYIELGNDMSQSGWTKDEITTVSFEVTDPPREWKFGDIVTREAHPDGEWTAVDKAGDSWTHDFDWEETSVWTGYAPFRLVAIDGKVLD